MKNNQQGFTLIEVMVALVIVVVSVVGLMKATSQSATSTMYFKDKTLASIIASNLAIDIRLYNKPNAEYIDEKYKMAGNEWPYRIHTTKKTTLFGELNTSEILVYATLDEKNNKQHIAQIEVVLEAPIQATEAEKTTEKEDKATDRYNKQSGFTLIELIIAIVIFALIALAAQSSLFNFSKSSKNIQNQIENIEKLQQLMIFLDRDFSQILDQYITLEDNQITIKSVQNDAISDISYNFNNEKIIRTEEGNEIIFMEEIKNLKLRVADNSGNLHTNWSKRKTAYLQAIEIKFDSAFGEIIKMVLIDE